jgi:hypothetical protein
MAGHYRRTTAENAVKQLAKAKSTSVQADFDIAVRIRPRARYSLFG